MKRVHSTPGLLITLGALSTCTSRNDATEQFADVIFHVSPRDHHAEPTLPKLRRITVRGTQQAFPGIETGFAYELDPRGQFILLTRNDDIVRVDVRNGSQKVIAPSPARDWYPKPSPDGRWVLFESDRASFRDLYKVALTGGSPIRLTDNREGNFDGAWSPDSRRIAFASSRHRQLDLFIMNADGSLQTRLTQHPGDSVKPAFSPSGQWIAFISARDGQDDLYVVRPDGSDLRRLTPAPSGAKLGQPGPNVERYQWHPREDRIAYHCRPHPGIGSLFVVDVPEGRPKRLSPDGVDDREPAWSPHGRFLVFASSGEIFGARSDGTGRTRLTQDRRPGLASPLAPPRSPIASRNARQNLIGGASGR